MRRPLLVAAALAAPQVLLAGAGSACEIFESRFSDRISVAEDGSFTLAGPEDAWSGRPIQDVGGGIVVQRQVRAACGHYEALQVVDCSSSDLAFVEGAVPEALEFSFMAPRLLDVALYPGGPLTVRQGDTFREIVANAEAAGIEVKAAFYVADYAAAWDRPDPFLGCDLFYPDSVGARR